MLPATLPAAFSGSNLYKAPADSDQTDTDAEARRAQLCPPYVRTVTFVNVYEQCSAILQKLLLHAHIKKNCGFVCVRLTFSLSIASMKKVLSETVKVDQNCAEQVQQADYSGLPVFHQWR